MPRLRPDARPHSPERSPDSSSSGSSPTTREPVVVLKKGREASARRRHPWLFDNAIARVEGSPAPGDTVLVRASKGEVVGRGAWSPRSKIAVRLWTYGHQDSEVDQGLIRQRVESALALRRDRLAEPRGGCRLIFAESDGLPGVIADRYADVIVVMFLAAGAERWRHAIVDSLRDLLEPTLGPLSIYERSDSSMRTREGLEQRAGVVSGDEPPEQVEILERGCRYLVDVRQGHKTGFYLDQHDSRASVAARAGGEMLNAFSYTGGFSIAALVEGTGVARATNIDSSADALALAGRHAELNGVAARAEQLEGNVFEVLRKFRAENRRFDTIVLDPPKFADSRARVQKAARGYKDINLLACQLLNPGGLLATFSCSGMLEPSLFQKIVADAALDAGRFGRIVERLGHPDDHPVALAFPEGRYLKGLLVRVE